MCAKRLVNLGHVIKVIYGEEYRLGHSKKILQGAGIEVEQFGQS
jgi:deoxycytidylate deaminase